MKSCILGLVSIIIPVYNKENFLSKCLDSVINQSFKNIEIVCVNDGSTDNSINILRDYEKKDSRFLIIDKPNGGVSSARNEGIFKCSGEYIMFVDPDDYIELNAVELLYNNLIEQNVDMVKGNYCIHDGSYKSTAYLDMSKVNNKKILSNSDDFKNLVVSTLSLNNPLIGSVCTSLVKKSCILKTNLFNINLVLAEDRLFLRELMEHINSIFFVDIIVYNYFLNSSSCTVSTKNILRNAYNLISAIPLFESIVSKSKFRIPNELVNYNTNFLNGIINSFFVMYRNKIPKEEIIKEIKKIITVDEVQKLFETADYSILSFHVKVPIKLIKKGHYNALFVFYWFRNFMRKLVVKRS